MAHPNEDLARASVAALQSGDVDALRSKYFAEDIRWHAPGQSQIARDYEGIDDVLGYFGRIFELTGGTFSVELHDVLANDEHVVILFTSHGERDGRRLADREVLTGHMADGKLAEVWIHPDVYALDEFFA